MKTKLTLFAMLITSFLLNYTHAQVNVKDSLALVDLYKSTNGPNWNFHANWLTKKPLAQWYGVVVIDGRVDRLRLFANNLTGTLPASLGDLDNMTALLMDNNHISGSIPASVGKLKKMDFFNIADNELSGELPSSMGDMRLLTGISLGDNQLTGKLPEVLGNCALLSSILLYNNKLTGNLPASFIKLTQLTYIDLTQNKLSGTLEDVFAKECQLTTFEIGYNNFKGNVPVFLSRFGDLQSLSLDHNHFIGQIPNEFERLIKLQYLDLSGNQLTGSIPTYFKNFTDMSILALYDNQLTNDYNPPFDGILHRRQEVYLHKNKFTFNGLEYLAQKYEYVYYNPQAPIAIHSYQNGLAVSAGGTLSNNTYRWFKTGNATPVTITGDSTFQPAESGQYYARVTNSIVVGLTLKTDTVNYVLSSENKGLNIKAYPNPAKDVIIVTGLDKRFNTKIAITDVSGYTYQHMMSFNKTTVQYNVSRLITGNYLIIVSNGKEVKTIQFVKE